MCYEFISGLVTTMLKEEFQIDGNTGVNRSAGTIMIAIVHSTDGKYHRVVFDRSRQFIEFTLIG